MDIKTKERLLKHRVRLFPTAHITSDKEAEIRATASLLVMVHAVSEFGRSFVRTAKGPSGHLSCFTEVPLRTEEVAGGVPRELWPDGMIRAVRGGVEWKALLEVKVGDNPLNKDQFNAYHQLARNKGFNALITISNQSADASGLPPIPIDRRHLRKVPVFHFSWERLLSEASLLSKKKTIKDSDQKWMLDEWIRYVDDDDSKIIARPNLGEKWNEVLQAARTGNLRGIKHRLEDVVQHWDGFIRKAALRLRAKLGVEVEPRLSRRERAEPRERIKRILDYALLNDSLLGALKIPHTAGDLEIDLNLRSKNVQYRVILDPPLEGRQASRVRFLTRQLREIKEAPEDLVVVLEWSKKGLESRAKLRDLREDNALIMRDSSGRLVTKDVYPRRFRFEWTTALQKGKGRSNVTVLEGISNNLEKFYQSIVEKLRPWRPPTPKLSKVDTQSVDEGLLGKPDEGVNS